MSMRFLDLHFPAFYMLWMAECTTIFQWTMHIFLSSTASSYSNRLFEIIRNKKNSFANTTKLFQLLLKDSNFFQSQEPQLKLLYKII